jgi:CheY-like chemotaxis protein/HPt (histidine-containing phosphotransfer) domain-containing protein
MVKASADSLLSIINDILDFSKIEAGKLDLDPINFHLRDSIEETIKGLALRADQKGLELACHIPPDTPDLLVGDPGRLRQIIINLAGNAIKFTSQGEVVVSVLVEKLGPDNVLLHFTVKDTGMGVPADKQKVIFEAFSQADGSTTRRYGGTGLGLAISSKLVAIMGGEIWLESELGSGSTFHFTAKFGVQKEVAAQRARRRDVNLPDLSVLVVDDNATNRRILEGLLAQWDIRTTLVESGLEAMQALDRAKTAGAPFQLVLLDAQMPEMDGFTLAENIKGNPDFAGATIMMLSSSGQRGDAARCRELGIAAYLTKPVMESELSSAILRVLNVPATEESQIEVVTRHTLREERDRYRVLLAEDNKVNQKLASRLLEKQGHSVVIAINGREAVAAFESEAFDLILMDVQMPELNGYEATAAIREREKVSGRHIPIIAMTAHAMKGDRERCLQAGMDGYVSKPIDTRELFDAIEQVTARVSRNRGEAPALTEVFDREEALARGGGDMELLLEIAKLFLDECPSQLAEIRDAVARSDSEALERVAHALKGAVGNFGAKLVYAAADKLEMMGRAGNVDGGAEACTELTAEVERLKRSLSALLSEAEFCVA